MAIINPYLSFNGNCEEAFNFYKSIFGGEFPTLMRFKDEPSGKTKSGSEAEKIMHVSLPIGRGTVLMGSDWPKEFGKIIIGNNFSISISTESKSETDRIFNALSAGGKVTMPMNDTFWGSYFGMFADKFGIQWMVSFDSNQQK